MTDNFVAKCKSLGVEYITGYKIYRIGRKGIFGTASGVALRKSGLVFARYSNGMKLREDFTYDMGNPLGIHVWLNASDGYITNTRVRVKVRVNVSDIILVDSKRKRHIQLVARKIFVYKDGFNKCLEQKKELKKLGGFTH